ncbi:hypothetical protein C2E21_7646 [Chlorella sorokiniana]|uniref:DUF1995 domain-containing protein n=1 Tax=Chlorella sorokiniana TaxID=3076 RepID=A0A2P6TH17_CHLSO|nr:hypothetical protein C2E21_7646 [Chlorella sorokiniana]|eukprot:PRW33585.1 hypothetical protein C2E21_7646 [Chlorella sorokiniana]
MDTRAGTLDALRSVAQSNPARAVQLAAVGLLPQLMDEVEASAQEEMEEAAMFQLTELRDLIGMVSNAAREASRQLDGSLATVDESSGRDERQQLRSRLQEALSAFAAAERHTEEALQCSRLPVRCAAGGFGQQAAGTDAADASNVPNSREECIRQAASAIAAQLNTGGSSKGKGKGFGDGAGGRKLSVDVPVLESGAAASVQLAQEIIAALPKQLAKQFTVVSCEDGGAAPPSSSSGGGALVLGLQQALGGADLGGCLLIAAPASTQLDSVMRLLAYWRGPGAVVLNADWSADKAPVEQVAFIKSFEAVYCFLPLMVKVLFIGQDGAVFKYCTGGNPASTPWRIFGKEGNKLQPIGRMSQRPTNADLEATFYNAYAANNPLNKGLKGITGIFNGGKK